MEQVEGAKNKIMETVTGNPMILLITIGVLFIIIVAMYFGLFTGSKEKAKAGPGKSVPGDGVSDLDKLIDEIHSKQKGNA